MFQHLNGGLRTAPMFWLATWELLTRATNHITQEKFSKMFQLKYSNVIKKYFAFQKDSTADNIVQRL
jgi:hypothetical protein